MDFILVLLRLMDWLLYRLLAKSYHRATKTLKSYSFLLRNAPSLKPSQNMPFAYPNVSKCRLQNRENDTLVCDIHDGLLRPNVSLFPYFMLVAFEGGSIFRAFLLLLSCPVLWVSNPDLKLRLMIFITFCGLRPERTEQVSRTVLPKFYLENLHLQAYELLSATGCRIVFTGVPKVMVEPFSRDYLGADTVMGTDLHVLGGFFTGLVSGYGLLNKQNALKEHFGDKKPDIGIGRGSSYRDHLFLSLCKEAYVINKEDGRNSPVINGSSKMPRHRYPKPLVFHDGRLAFFPTPPATLLMFAWLPLGLALAIIRISIGVFLPYRFSRFFARLSGVSVTVKGHIPEINDVDPIKKGVLYVCSHRTLLDPVFLSSVLRKPLTAVTYSLSIMSELMAPIRTVRLTRERSQDRETMQRMLREGDLVVCPEGTTCREPYLLRFSPLFAELAEDIVPVAMKATVSMFYGTTASGFKCLDPLFFFMNPRPCYYIHLLEKLPREMTCAGGRSSCDVANEVQRRLADALGFECTALTRKDKYMMLAGNEGIVQDRRS